MIKNSVYFLVIALLVAKSFKILIYVTYRTRDVTKLTENNVKSQKMEYLFCIELKLCTVVIRIKKFHNMSTVTWQHNKLQALMIEMVKSAFPSFKKCYLLLMFIQWV